MRLCETHAAPRIDECDGRVNEVDAAFNEIDGRINFSDAPINVVDGRVNLSDAPFNEVDAAVNEIDVRINKVDAPSNEVELRVNEVEPPIDEVDGRVNEVDGGAFEVDGRAFEFERFFKEPRRLFLEIENVINKCGRHLILHTSRPHLPAARVGRRAVVLKPRAGPTEGTWPRVAPASLKVLLLESKVERREEMPRGKSIEEVLARGEKIERVWDANSTFTLGELTREKFKAGLEALRESRAQLEEAKRQVVNLTNATNGQAEAVLDNVIRALAGIRAVFGPDSTQYDEAGGTRSSEVKRTRKSKKGGDS